MSEFNVTVESGKSIKPPTAGKYCDRDIVVTAEGGGQDSSPYGYGEGEMLGDSFMTPSKNSLGSCSNLRVKFYNATSVPEMEFCGCPGLKEVHFPNATIVGDNAFTECTGLEIARFDVARSLGDSAFSDCNKLHRVELPKVTSVGMYAFLRCTSLTSIDLPSATSIGMYAFNTCVYLNAVILRTTETVCVIDPTALITLGTAEEPRQLVNIYIPAVMFELYRSVYEPAFEQYGFAGYFDIVFHKIEDYPEICG